MAQTASSPATGVWRRRAELGLEKVPVIELAHLTPAQKRALVLADNRLALDAGWDEEMLALELAELPEAGYDLALTGFDGCRDRGAAGTLGRRGHDRGSRRRRGRGRRRRARAPPAVPVSRAGDSGCSASTACICADASDHEAVQR
ncbi:MAG: hypothetical protein KatS3mg122_2120 [Caldimonas sp.]|nr:MAG: hypothetical protein KatS3mg122_2120 [Caldimonas sp.]